MGTARRLTAADMLTIGGDDARHTHCRSANAPAQGTESFGPGAGDYGWRHSGLSTYLGNLNAAVCRRRRRSPVESACDPSGKLVRHASPVSPAVSISPHGTMDLWPQRFRALGELYAPMVPRNLASPAAGNLDALLRAGRLDAGGRTVCADFTEHPHNGPATHGCQPNQRIECRWHDMNDSIQRG